MGRGRKRRHEEIDVESHPLNWLAELPWFEQDTSLQLTGLNESAIRAAAEILKTRHATALTFVDASSRRIIYDNRLTFLPHLSCIVLVRCDNVIRAQPIMDPPVYPHGIAHCFYKPLYRLLRLKATDDTSGPLEEISAYTHLNQFREFTHRVIDECKPVQCGALRIVWHASLRLFFSSRLSPLGRLYFRRK